MKAIERLNELLSEKISKTCSSCGCKMPANARFNICDECFTKRRSARRPEKPRGERGDNRPEGNRERSHGPGKSRDSYSSKGSSSTKSNRSGPTSSGAKKKSSSGTKNVANAYKKFR